jgi:hypothetical protein
MASDILTVENLARHIELQTHHRYYERNYHTSRDRLIEVLTPLGHWGKDGYMALIRAFERHSFQQKLFALEHPDLHEHFTAVIPVVQLIVTGPPALAPTRTPGAHTSDSLTSPGYIEYLIEKYLPPTEEMKPGG